MEVHRVPESQKPFAEWPDLASIIWVERSGTRAEGGPFCEEHFFITSQPEVSTAEAAAQVRGHWQIENGLHWVKDVVQGEDACTTRAGQAPQNLALLRNWVLTLYRRAGYASLSRALRFFAHDIGGLCSLLE